MNKGRIVQVMGPVIDVEFENGDLPMIKDALEVMNGNKRCVMEVAQHMGDNIVRCIMLASSEGLHKDMEVTATGSGIKVPVGPKTLGRLFNVLGETIDNKEEITGLTDIQNSEIDTFREDYSNDALWIDTCILQSEEDENRTFVRENCTIIINGDD